MSWTTDYLRGYLDALWSYAHWKDGVAYVGSSGKTYKEAEKWALEQAATNDGEATGANPEKVA